MTATAPETPELPTVGEAGAVFNPLHAVRSIGLSLFINGVCPYILYRVLAPHYPAGSVIPLVYASVFPILGLVLGHIRTRMVDFIAVIALFEISYNIVTALAAPNVHWAIILRSMEGYIVATIFLVLTLLRHPPIFYIARQFVGAGNPALREGFLAANAADKGRAFTVASLVWVVGITIQTSLNLTLALTVTPANYLLIAQVLSTTMNVVLIAWSIRYTTKRLERYRPAA